MALSIIALVCMLHSAYSIPANGVIGNYDQYRYVGLWEENTSTAREIAFSKIQARVEGTALAAQELGLA